MLRLYTRLAQTKNLALNSLLITQTNTRYYSSKPKPATGTDKKLKDNETLEYKAPYNSKVGKFPLKPTIQSQYDHNLKKISTNSERDKKKPESQSYFDINLMRYIEELFSNIYDKVFNTIDKSLNKSSGILSRIARYCKVENIYLASGKFENIYIASGLKFKRDYNISISVIITISDPLKTNPTTLKKSNDPSIDNLKVYSSKDWQFFLDQNIPAPSECKSKNRNEKLQKRYLILQLYSKPHMRDLRSLISYVYEHQNVYLSIVEKYYGFKFTNTTSKIDYKEIFDGYKTKLIMYPVINSASEKLTRQKNRDLSQKDFNKIKTYSKQHASKIKKNI